MPTDVVMTLLAAVLVVVGWRASQGARFPMTAAFVLGLYCGAIRWIGPNLHHFFDAAMAFLAAKLQSH
ncbi:hypothetical protein ACPCTO_37650 [Streptomyces olivoreticuli]